MGRKSICNLANKSLKLFEVIVRERRTPQAVSEDRRKVELTLHRSVASFGKLCRTGHRETRSSEEPFAHSPVKFGRGFCLHP